MFSLQKNQRRGWNRFCLAVGSREKEGGGKGAGYVTQTMYIDVSKC
jgi:hypothetical protein